MSMKLRSALLISTSLLLTSNLCAGVVYSYESPTFSGFAYVTPGSGLTSSTFISASVTYNSVLAPNLSDFSTALFGGSVNYGADTPSSWLFSDGVEQWTPANSNFFVAVVNTDPSGNITGWDFDLYSNPGLTYPEVYIVASTPPSIEAPYGTYGSAEVNMSFTQPYATAYVNYGPGVDTTWTPSTSGVPEPTTLCLVVLGGIAVGLKRRLRTS